MPLRSPQPQQTGERRSPQPKNDDRPLYTSASEIAIDFAGANHLSTFKQTPLRSTAGETKRSPIGSALGNYNRLTPSIPAAKLALNPLPLPVEI